MEREERKEREGRGREVGRRGGGEKRKGIVIGGMALLLVLGCNNGGEERLAAERRLGEIGRSVEKAFYEFIDLIAGSLGFTAKATTKKEDVGKYFNGLGEKLGKASEELEKVAKQSETDGDKEGLLSKGISKGIREAVEAAKTTLSALKGHVESLKDIGDGTVVGDAQTSQKEGTAADDDALKKAYKALKGIVEIAEKEGVAKPAVGNITLNNGIDNSTGAKILSTNNADKPGAAEDSGKAASIVSSVSGKEMLASIVASKEEHVKALTGAASVTTTPLEFAKGSGGNHLGTNATPKAEAVAAGIALRSLVKTGKLGAHSSNDNKAVQSAGITAANKLLVAVEDIIKKTVKNVLGTAKQKIDEARAPKAESQK